MEYTTDYIKEHQDEFIVPEATEKGGYLSQWNWHHGYWVNDSEEQNKEIESRIKWVYAIMPYLYDGKIYGVRPVKGFVIKLDDDLCFTSAGDINGLWNEWFGHTINFRDTTEDDDEEYKEMRNAFRMFSTEEEAKMEADKFAQSNELKVLDIKIGLTKEKLDKIQKTYDNLLKKKEKLLKKKK